MPTDPDPSGASKDAQPDVFGASPALGKAAESAEPAGRAELVNSAEPAKSAEPTDPAESAAPAAWTPDEPDFEQRVLRAFIRDGRLTSIPARERKKLVVYRYLLDRVLPDPAEIVAERDLNMRLALWHPDVATIRRAFVDLQLASRDGMAYRRVMSARG